LLNHERVLLIRGNEAWCSVKPTDRWTSSLCFFLRPGVFGLSAARLRVSSLKLTTGSSSGGEVRTIDGPSASGRICRGTRSWTDRSNYLGKGRSGVISPVAALQDSLARSRRTVLGGIEFTEVGIGAKPRQPAGDAYASQPAGEPCGFSLVPRLWVLS
jgi:hypothetical protein